MTWKLLVTWSLTRKVLGEEVCKEKGQIAYDFSNVNGDNRFLDVALRQHKFIGFGWAN